MNLDPRDYVRARVAAAAVPPAFDNSVAGQTEMRAKLALRLGGLDTWERPPLEPQVIVSQQMDGYRRETTTFTTRPGLQAFGYFLVPDNTPPGQPAVLCLPGHGRGVDSIVGIAEDGTQRPLRSRDEYQADFALQCVAAGYPMFALEQISFGHRRDEQAKKAGAGASSCTRDSMAALMLGETMTGWRVWDAIRALDYMATRPEVDAERMATMGISGGGLTALFTAALDTRVKVAIVSGYLNTFADSILSVDHCPDNYVPGLLGLCEMPGLLGLVAPRALFAESGDQDPIFPRAAFEYAVEQGRLIYEAFQASGQFAAEVFAGDHRFHGEGAFRFLRKRL